MIRRTEKDFWVEMAIREISTQAHFAEVVYKNLQPNPALSTDAVFISIHAFLVHCANVSKMLMASDKKMPKRMLHKILEYIRRLFHSSKRPIVIGKILNIPKKSIVHNRKFRNSLEHYDNELKNWIKAKGANANIGTYNVGPKSAIKIPNMVFVSHYDPTTHIFTFVDNDLDLESIHKEVRAIRSTADNWVHLVEIGKVTPPFV